MIPLEVGRTVLGDLPPWWQLLPFLAVTGLLLWFLGRRLPAVGWLIFWVFFLVVGYVDFRQDGALGAWLALSAGLGTAATGYVIIRRTLPP